MDNSSYVIASSDGKTLYSIADEGVVAFRILENGSLARLNSASIRGMRGCNLCTDAEDKYVFVSGYHDGKATVLSLNPDGSVGSIVDGVFDKGYGLSLIHILFFCTFFQGNMRFFRKKESINRRYV